MGSPGGRETSVGETVSGGRAAWVQAEVVDRPMAGGHSWGAGVGGSCPTRQGPGLRDPAAPGPAPPAPPAQPAGPRPWALRPPPALSSRTGLGLRYFPCCCPSGPHATWGPVRAGVTEEASGLCHASSQERWFRNSSSGLRQGQSPSRNPPRACAGVWVRDPPRASPPLVLEYSSFSSPACPLLWPEAPSPAAGGTAKPVPALGEP